MIPTDARPSMPWPREVTQIERVWSVVTLGPPRRSTVPLSGQDVDQLPGAAGRECHRLAIARQRVRAGQGTAHDRGRVHLKLGRDGLLDQCLVDVVGCLLYTSDAADEEDSVDLGGR